MHQSFISQQSLCAQEMVCSDALCGVEKQETVQCI